MRKRLLPKSLISHSELDLFPVRASWEKQKVHVEPTGAPGSCFGFGFGPTVLWETHVRYDTVRGSLVGRAGGQADGADGRAMPGPRSWMAFVGADTQSGQINFTAARRNNVIGGVRLEMSA